MALNFDPSAYLQVWAAKRQEEQNRPDLNQVTQPLLQGLQMMAENRRQQQLMDLANKKEGRESAEFTYKYGNPISPDISVGESGGIGQSRLFGNSPMAVGSGGRLIDQFNKWRAGGMKTTDARPEFMGALGQEERKQFYETANPKPVANYVIPEFDMGTGKPTGNFTPLPAGTKPAPFARPSAAATTQGVSYDAASPQEKSLADAMIRGDISSRDLSFRDRGRIVAIANDRATQQGIPFQSYGGEVKAGMAKNLAYGKMGMNALSFNTALGHIGDAIKSYQAIGNIDQRWLNKPINILKRQTNDPNVTALDVNLNAVAGELATVFKGSSGTDQEIGHWAEVLTSDLTPRQAQAALQKAGELLNSRLDSMKYQQQNVMGNTNTNRQLLSPHGEDVMNKLSSFQQPIIQRNKRTGQTRISYDGGQTWQIQ